MSFPTRSIPCAGPSTTALNARLIPLIGELIAAVKRSLTAAGIDAPLMIVRGDGSLMTEQFAGERPVETLLSGPAASVVGAMGLGGLSDCVMLDVGGTTTDMAVARERPAAPRRRTGWMWGLAYRYPGYRHPNHGPGRRQSYRLR